MQTLCRSAGLFPVAVGVNRWCGPIFAGSKTQQNMEIAKRYDPSDSEDKWYAYWMEQGYFRSQPDDREPFTIVIPPPNVTGVLHMGHMLNNTIQDVLIRRARMMGKNACWVPGTDHASIATEAKVVRKLREEGISKWEIGREKFLDHAWEWTHKHGGIILEQLKKLGASCDWDRTRFTMEDDLSARNAPSESLREQLLWQLGLTRLSDTDRLIALAIIDDTDANGRLLSTVEEIHESLAVDLDIEEDTSGKKINFNSGRILISTLEQY